MKYPRFFKRVRAATPEPIMFALADFASAVPADQEIVELGVFQGRSTLMMAWGARQGQGAHVTGVDPWDLPGNVYDPPFTESASRRWAHHWVQSLGYSRDITLVHGFSADLAETWTGKPVGLLYVDGDHTKEGARRDIEAWARHLAPGARIAVDDYEHQDWPGVAEAVDELVAEGFLAPIELFHDRLAVTRLADAGEPKLKRTETTAITSEGVHPSPYPAVGGQVAASPEAAPEKAQATEPPWEVDPVDRHHEEAPAADSDTSSHGHHGDLERVGLGDALVVEASVGQPITELSIPTLKALARHRGIVLGVRKDKRDLILQALRDGR